MNNVIDDLIYGATREQSIIAGDLDPANNAVVIGDDDQRKVGVPTRRTAAVGLTFNCNSM